MLPSSAQAFGDMYDDIAVEQTPEQKELENIQGFFYESPITVNSPVPTVTELRDPYIKDFGGMPLFKQLRIKTTNYFKTKAHEEYLEEKRLQEEELKKYQEELEKEASLDDLQDENLKNFFDVANKEKKENKKFNLFKKNKQEEPIKEDNKEQNTETSEEEVLETPQEQVTKIEGTIKKVEAEKDVILDCEIVNYFDETGEVEALGRPKLKFPAQETILIADRITYNTEANIIKAFGNVEVIKKIKKCRGIIFKSI